MQAEVKRKLFENGRAESLSVGAFGTHPDPSSSCKAPVPKQIVTRIVWETAVGPFRANATAAPEVGRSPARKRSG